MTEEINIKLSVPFANLRNASLRIEDSLGNSALFNVSSFTPAPPSPAPAPGPHVNLPTKKSPAPAAPVVPTVVAGGVKDSSRTVALSPAGKSAHLRATAFFEPICSSYPAFVRSIGACFNILTMSKIYDAATLDSVIERIVAVTPTGQGTVLQLVRQTYLDLISLDPASSHDYAAGVSCAAHDCLIRRGLNGVF